jgi:hypothetical protein
MAEINLQIGGLPDRLALFGERIFINQCCLATRNIAARHAAMHGLFKLLIRRKKAAVSQR